MKGEVERGEGKEKMLLRRGYASTICNLIRGFSKYLESFNVAFPKSVRDRLNFSNEAWVTSCFEKKKREGKKKKKEEEEDKEKREKERFMHL